MKKEDLEMLMAGLGSGLLVGGVLGLLFAPESGKELRMKLTDISTDISGRINRFKEPEKYSRIKA